MDLTGCIRALALAAAALLAACGGGGDGGFFPGALPPTGGGFQPVTLSGTATFESVPNTSGPLNYAAAVAKPVRGALVEIVDAASGTVLASTATDATGAYSSTVPANTAVLVRVKAQSVQSGGPGWDVSVRDNTRGDAIYAIESPAFNTGVIALSRDLNAPSGWSGAGYGALRAAAPFALLDTVYIAQSKVLSVAPSVSFPPLRVFWSVNNVPAPGNVALGQIGTSSFVSSAGGRAIYVLGKEDVDTDEYDQSVIAHEWGHYYESAFSRDDSPGGSHALSQSLDRRVAFSEGWGNAWSGIALARANYTDSQGARQAQGSNIDLRSGPASNPGWYREGSIQAVLWNLNEMVGFKPIHDALTGPFRTSIPVTSIHPFAAAFNSVAPATYAVLGGLLTTQNISAVPNDPFGVQETNNGGVAQALPMYIGLPLNTPTQACVTNQAGAGNKLGSYVYLRFTAQTARAYQILVSGGPPGADPDLVIFSGRELARSQGLGSSESASANLPAGHSVLAVNDFNNSSVNTCFTVTIN